MGQLGYGYRSIEAFINASVACRDGTDPAVFDVSLATVHCTLQGTAILEAGRRSLDAKGAAVHIVYGSADACEPLSLRVEASS